MEERGREGSLNTIIWSLVGFESLSSARVITNRRLWIICNCRQPFWTVSAYLGLIGAV